MAALRSKPTSEPEQAAYVEPDSAWIDVAVDGWLIVRAKGTFVEVTQEVSAAYGARRMAHFWIWRRTEWHRFAVMPSRVCGIEEE